MYPQQPNILFVSEDKKLVCADTNHKKQTSICVSINHIKQFFFYVRTRTKNEMCVGTNQIYQSSWSVRTYHKRQIFFYKKIKTKTWCILTQIRIIKVHEVLAQIIRDIFLYERTKRAGTGMPQLWVQALVLLHSCNGRSICFVLRTSFNTASFFSNEISTGDMCLCQQQKEETGLEIAKTRWKKITKFMHHYSTCQPQKGPWLDITLEHNTNL